MSTSEIGRQLPGRFALASLLALILVSQAPAQEAPNPNTNTSTTTKTTTITTTTTNVTWGGLSWGLGIAADFDVNGSRVADATIINNNIVRVTDTSSNLGVGFVLEAHYFLRDYIFSSAAKRVMCSIYCSVDLADGPFVAIEVGGGSSAKLDEAGPITGYALGWMVGLHHPNAPSATSSWNLGIGLRVDPRAKVLGDGFVPNQPPPPGETTVRFKTEPRAAVMLLSSFSF